MVAVGRAELILGSVRGATRVGGISYS
eukprot:COSAG05_NODE_17962_length_316_cov_0.870968_1_plen_26_part_10